MGIFISWIVLSFVVGFVGSNRRIGFGGAFLLSLLLSPLIGLIITVVSKNKEDEKYKDQILSVQKEQKATLEKLFETESPKRNASSVINELHKLKNLRDSEIITDKEFQKLKSRIIDRVTEDTTSNNSSSSKNTEQVLSEDNLEELKKSLQDDEIIILINRTLSLKVIKKSEHEKNKELHLTKGYTIIDANE